MRELTTTQARQRALLGESNEGYKIVQRSLQARLIDALRQNTAFVTHFEYQLLVSFTSEKSANVFSTKDSNEYKVDFEVDVNDDVRITKIAPLGPLGKNQQVTYEHLHQQMIAGLPITEKLITEVRALDEQDEKFSAQKLQLEQLQEQRVAGLISHEQYFEKRDRLLLDQHKERTGGKKLLFEDGEDNATKRKKIWEAQQAGKLTIEEAAEQAAKIRLAEERAAKPKWLMESQECPDDCECHDCSLAEFKVLLESRVDDGSISREQATRCFNIRCNLD